MSTARRTLLVEAVLLFWSVVDIEVLITWPVVAAPGLKLVKFSLLLVLGVFVYYYFCYSVVTLDVQI